MQTEFEIKILEIDKENLLKQIKSLGFKNATNHLYRRYVYEINDYAWVRLRSDGATSALTYKTYEKNAIDGVRELEIEVLDFEKTNEMMTVLGFEASKYQENKRISFKNGEVELAIDEWPHIPAYIEIESNSVELVKKYIELLRLTNYESTSEPTSAVYSKYGLDINNYSRLTFNKKDISANN